MQHEIEIGKKNIIIKYLLNSYLGKCRKAGTVYYLRQYKNIFCTDNLNILCLLDKNVTSGQMMCSISGLNPYKTKKSRKCRYKSFLYTHILKKAAYAIYFKWITVFV